MSNTQLFLAIAALVIGQTGALATAFKLYLDVKVDPIKAQVDLLVRYMIEHEGKIAVLEERTKKGNQ